MLAAYRTRLLYRGGLQADFFLVYFLLASLKIGTEAPWLLSHKRLFCHSAQL